MGRTFRRGLSIIEVLLGLAITAILATSLFTAMNASAKGIQANQDLFSATQTARVATRNMARKIRVVDHCQVGEGRTEIGGTGPQTVLYTSWRELEAGVEVLKTWAYIYDAEHKQLLLDTAPPLVTTANPVLDDVRGRINSPTRVDGKVYVLARQVEDMSFVGEYVERWLPDPSVALGESLQIVLANVQINMKVMVTQNPNEPGRVIELCESAVPRRVFEQR